MKILVSRKPASRVLRWMQRLLFAGAVSSLGYCGFALLDSRTFQNRERRHFEQLLYLQPPANGAARPTPAPVSPTTPAQDATGGLIGRLEIPRLGLSVIIIEGASGSTLRRAVGHIAGTALPGRPGNVGLAGHRDTFFRLLSKIRENDLITVTTRLGGYRYRVVSITIVSPTDVAVLNPTANQLLTLVTCYPFGFVGPAPERFIVTAERIA